jgi:gliding motility-associated-like protein
MRSYSKIFIALIAFCTSISIYSQNLVLNPSFENVNQGSLNCSWYTTAAGFNNAINNWTLPTGGSSDIFHTSLATSCYCSTFSTHGDNPGQQEPRTGNAYVNIVTHGSGGCTPYREYVQGQLSSPLVVGETYAVELYVSLADKMNKGTNNIGIKFSQTPYYSPSMCVYNTVPDLNYVGPIIMDKINWTLISFTYTPTVAGLQNFIIGNFYNDANTLTQAAPTGWQNTIRYFVDDVSITPLSVSSAGIGGPVAICSTDASQDLFSTLVGNPSTTGTWSGPSVLGGGHLGTFNPTVHLAGEYVYTVPGGNPSTANVQVTIAQPQTPSFNDPGVYCSGAQIPPLPSTSLNGIVGTWTPAINNAQTSEYTFTPNAGQCAVDTSLSIAISPSQTPSFEPYAVYCSGDAIPALPTTSLNGIVGSWSPAINNTQTTTYTFTPNQGVCATNTTLTVTVNPVSTPTFAAVAPYCIGATIQELPTTSLNGIPGSWSPVLNTTQTTTYTFTPSVGQCATAETLTITINQSITPSFDSAGPFCSGEQIAPLATTSLNGISGTWSPAISNLETTTYTFAPNPSECASINTLTITVVPNVTPTFEPYNVYCSGGSIPELPTTSLNGVSGTWSPAMSNSASGIYTFMPSTSSSGGVCANSATMSVEITSPTQSTTSLSVCTANLPYLWNGLSLDNSGQYQVLLSTNLGCDSIANLNLTVVPNVTSTTNIAICENQAPYLWNGLSLSASGTTSVNFSSSQGCDSIAILNLTIYPMPEVSFTTLTGEGCAPVEVQFSNTSNVQNGSCVWNLGNGIVLTTCDMAVGNYNTGCYDVSLQVTSPEGCTSLMMMEDIVCIEPRPVASFVADPTVLTTIEPTTQFTNTSSGHVDQTWNFGDDSPSNVEANPTHAYPNEAGYYFATLVVSNANGCLDSVTQVITVENEVIFYVPNTFTPDGDAYNNSFLPVFTEGFDLYNYNLLIFNRWGEVLFESNNAKVGWDGTYGGEMCMSGTYIYQISFKEIDKDKRQIIRGSIHLLR